MAPSSRSGEFDPPEDTVSARVATLIERMCVGGVWLSRPIVLIIVTVFLAYAIGGFFLIELRLWTPSYPFLSLTDDVYFAWLAFLSGCGICIGTGSLIGIAFLEDGEGPVHNEISILASFIGFGFGAGVIRMTYPIVLATVF